MSDSEVKQDISIEELQEQLAAKDAQIADVTTQFEAVKAKADQLLDETKKAKAMKREAEEAAKREAEDKARQDGDFKQLLESSEAERTKLYEELTGLKTSITKEKVSNAALKIANELADGSNAEILSEFISRRLQWTEDGVKVTDDSGSLTVSTVDQLKDEFKNNPKYKSLIRGIKSTGGGATPTSDGVAATNQRTAEEIRAMDPMERGKFFAKGGTVKQEH